MAYYPLSYILIVLLGFFVKVTYFYNLLFGIFSKTRSRGGAECRKGCQGIPINLHMLNTILAKRGWPLIGCTDSPHFSSSSPTLLYLRPRVRSAFIFRAHFCTTTVAANTITALPYTLLLPRWRVSCLRISPRSSILRIYQAFI